MLPSEPHRPRCRRRALERPWDPDPVVPKRANCPSRTAPILNGLMSATSGIAGDSYTQSKFRDDSILL
jgi:hypothetical protein